MGYKRVRLIDFLKFIGVKPVYLTRLIYPASKLVKHELISNKGEINFGGGWGLFYVVCKKLRNSNKYINVVTLEHAPNMMSDIPIMIIRQKWQLPGCTEYKEYLPEGYHTYARRHIMSKNFHDIIRKVVKEDGVMTEKEALEVNDKYVRAVRRVFVHGTPENNFMKSRGVRRWSIQLYCLYMYDVGGFYNLQKYNRAVYYNNIFVKKERP